jgi:hypothetical protein
MIRQLFRPFLLLLFVLDTTFAQPPDPVSTVSSAQYMASEGLMVVHCETKVLFNPLFANFFRTRAGCCSWRVSASRPSN